MSRSIAARLATKGPSLEKVFWLWSLARLGARHAIPDIRALRATEEDWTKLARVADVVLDYLNEGEAVTWIRSNTTETMLIWKSCAPLPGSCFEAKLHVRRSSGALLVLPTKIAARSASFPWTS